MTAPECRRAAEDRSSRNLSCLARLADGWILATDLCPTCTQAFMTALDGIAGPLVWHQAYIERAEG